MKAYYTVFWDNSNGTDDDFTTIWPLEAFGKYHTLKAPYKRLVMTDREHGDRTLLSSRGEDNMDKYHVRYLFILAIERRK